MSQFILSRKWCVGFHARQKSEYARLKVRELGRIDQWTQRMQVEQQGCTHLARSMRNMADPSITKGRFCTLR